MKKLILFFFAIFMLQISTTFAQGCDADMQGATCDSTSAATRIFG